MIDCSQARKLLINENDFFCTKICCSKDYVKLSITPVSIGVVERLMADKSWREINYSLFKAFFTLNKSLCCVGGRPIYLNF